MSVKHAVLGLVIERPGYGYELIQRLEQRIEGWRPSETAVYPALRSLRAEGMIRAREATRRRRRRLRASRRRLVRGDRCRPEEFRAWVREPTDLAPQRDPFWLKVAFASPEDLPWLVELARELEAACLERMAELSEQGGGVEDLRRERRRVAGDRPGVAAPHRGRAARRPHRGRAADPRGDEARDPAPRARTRAVLARPRARRAMTLLALERVSKSHWRGRHEIVVLDGVSLEVDPGELVADLRPARRRQDDAAAHRGRHRTARRRLRALRRARARRGPLPPTHRHPRRASAGSAGRRRSRSGDADARPRRAAAAESRSPPTRPSARATRALKRVGVGELADARWHAAVRRGAHARDDRARDRPRAEAAARRRSDRRPRDRGARDRARPAALDRRGAAGWPC